MGGGGAGRRRSAVGRGRTSGSSSACCAAAWLPAISLVLLDVPHDDRGSRGDGPASAGGHRRTAGDRRDDVDDRPVRHGDAGPAAAARGRDGRLPRRSSRSTSGCVAGSATFDDLLPRRRSRGAEESTDRAAARRSASSRASRAAIGLADASPHALIGGPSGSGKTNLLLTMIARSPPGTPRKSWSSTCSTSRRACPSPSSPPAAGHPWLPHARLVGVNINTDREFGLALLQHLADGDAPPRRGGQGRTR